ncbi:hypothetical protein ACFLTW_05725 [Chloroflexota bacterium]
MADGSFRPETDEEMVRELRVIVENLECNSYLVSDHVGNLLAGVEGKYPADKGMMLAVIDDYLALPEADRANFRLGRRLGIYQELSDMASEVRKQKVDGVLAEIEDEGLNLEKTIEKLKKRFF